MKIDREISAFYRHADMLFKDIPHLGAEEFETKYSRLQRELERLQKRVSLSYETSKQLEFMVRDRCKALKNANYLQSIASGSFNSTWDHRNNILEEGRAKVEELSQAYLLKMVRESVKHERIEEALHGIEKILKRDPNNESAHTLLAEVICR